VSLRKNTEGFYIYDTPENARLALKRFTKLRTTTEEDEVASPAEVWLLDKTYRHMTTRFDDIHDHNVARLIGIAISMNLCPAPEWFLVRERLRAKTKIEKLLALTKVGDELLTDARLLGERVTKAVDGQS
jgi:hypothetical protein